MLRTKRRAALAVAAGGALIASMAALPTVAAADDASGAGKRPGVSKGPEGDLVNTGPNYNNGKKKALDKSSFSQGMRRQGAAATAANSAVGDTKTWLANDDTEGIYVKDYTLRGIGDHIQVWVADDRAFPDGDCRNDLGLTEVTDAQVDSFVHEFDTNMYPKESKAFSIPPRRNGTKAPLTGILGLPADYYKVDTTQSDDIVVLVDNVRDANFYEPSSPDGQTYIAGFFYSVFNDYVNRNVMTIDVFDWLHRTGATPPNDSTNPEYIACASELGQTRPYGAPRPHQYEGTFAHEYQHLLEHYEDPDEDSWINEGLSDWAQTLVGYVNPAIAPDKPGADGHLACIAGYQPANFGGPENSLTRWSDQGGPEILCDYGAAYAFMEYLQSKYGNAFMTALHRQDANGIAGLDATLAQYGAGVSGMETINRWAAMVALDQQIDGSGGLNGGDPSSFTAKSLSFKVNWGTAQAYDTPGAPPNGSDYVQLRNGTTPLRSSEIGTIDFAGARTLAPTPVEWTVANTPPNSTDGITCGDVAAGAATPALYAGCGENLDRSIVKEFTLPAGSPKLNFDALWDHEEGWDYGYVQISEDGGKTWKSLSTGSTTTEHDPGAISTVVSQLPGFTGESGGWVPQEADLTPYAGKTVLIGFRQITDPGVNEAGFWVRGINVAGTAVPTTLDGWKTISQVRPDRVGGWTVQLVAYSGKGVPRYLRLPLTNAKGTLTGTAVQRALGSNSATVGAIVTFNDASESAGQQARYKLKVNGVLQPGG